MLWRRDTDNFTFAITYEIKDMFTKREVLSTISKLFDPLGLVGPVLTKATLIMQSLWTLKLNWDESLPTDVMQEWTSFLAQLRQVDQISVKRQVNADNTDAFEIHAFSDASQRAYGAVIYLRCVDTSGNFTTRLLCSKSRICPLKMLTIPRLELCGALLLARLVNTISLILELPISKTFCWTDSSIVLWWINTPVTNLKTYVANRVAEIVTLTGNCSWRWCRKEERSQSLDDLQRARAILVNKVQARHFGPELAALKNKKGISGSSKISSLNPFVDSNDNLRVGGRLTKAQIEFDAKHQLILPQHSKLTYLIFESFHKRYFHIGAQGLLHFVRLQFWPINGKSIARKVVHNCNVCFKNNPSSPLQLMGELPSERVNPVAPFVNSGVDFCGPFQIRVSNLRKAKIVNVYVSIFICISTKAIHLEIVSDLTSEAFIASLKRFISRRGKISSIISDNATNFKGANSEIKKLLAQADTPTSKLNNYLLSEEIVWKNIPPRSPHFGGLWESGVKSFKHHLKRTVGNNKLSFEEFTTVMVQIEAILNSRPLTPLSTDVNEYEVLTPGHFLIGRPLLALPEPNFKDIPESKLSKWQKLTNYVQVIWKRWQTDYLNHLQQRNKWQFAKDNVEVGTMVLLKEPNVPPLQWPLGRIVETIKGSDNKIRVVKIRTSNEREEKMIIANPDIYNIEFTAQVKLK
ncbi:uncharacterized protein LOC129218221 [Uloborus diversus]|uniref:uncharacterized protein LOC129218221 n=1 Tax=Uloborus diversus TaxID=327109 RepID=UPI00240A05D5|nr:uncharacterized protein LOC129218221 [Uloborus diversus]